MARWFPWWAWLEQSLVGVSTGRNMDDIALSPLFSNGINIHVVGCVRLRQIRLPRARFCAATPDLLRDSSELNRPRGGDSPGHRTTAARAHLEKVLL